MPLFQYEAYNKRGALISGTLDAASLQMVKDMLQGQGLMPTKIVESSALGSRSLWARLNEKKVDLKTVILFTIFV
ncbi:MAG: Type IV pilus inner membrane protein MshG, partial [candidate division TM6 bacterium GW2011_GWF2_38_10]